MNKETDSYKLDLFKFKHNFRVHFDECDSFSVVHNTVYFKYFERARIEYFRNLDMPWTIDSLGEDYYVAVAENKCKYLKPARYEALLTIYTRVSELRRASCKFEYIIQNRENSDLICEGYSIIVKIRPNEFKASSFTKRYIDTIKNFEGLA